MDPRELFEILEEIHFRPEPFEFYTADELWTDEHTSERMLAFHLDGEIDVSSRQTTFIDRSVEWIAGHFQVGPDTRIVDFGCGPGLYTIRLAAEGARVTGVDFSPRSIEYARETARRADLPIRYVHGNYLEFETEERFDLALMIMCDYCALSPGQRRELLGRFHAVLEPGGAVLLDVYSMKAFEQRSETAIHEANLLDGFWSPDRYYGFQNTFKYGPEAVVLDKYTLVEPARVRTLYNWLQYFSPESLQAELAAGGFAVQRVLGDVAGAPYDPESPEFAVIARS